MQPFLREREQGRGATAHAVDSAAGKGRGAADVGTAQGRARWCCSHHRHNRTDRELDELARRLATDFPDASSRVRVAVEDTIIEV